MFHQRERGWQPRDDEMFNVISVKDIQSKSRKRDHHTSIRATKRKDNSKSAAEGTEQSGTLMLLLRRWETGPATLDAVWQGLAFVFCRIDTRYIVENIIEVIYPYMVYNYMCFSVCTTIITIEF